jgi:hypothetical protein
VSRIAGGPIRIDVYATALSMFASKYIANFNAAVFGFVVVLVIGGCAPPSARQPDAPATVPAPTPALPSIVNPEAGAATEPALSKVTPATAASPAEVAKESATSVAKESTTPDATPPAAPVAKAPPAKVPAPPAHATPKATTPAAPAQTVAPKAPPLDLASLEKRLRETKAIGTLTKLTLKNQVDDLLDQFRTYYQGKLKIDLAALRRSYDLLVLKFISLLQDDDKPLAAAIVASREEIWGILSDPAKFATI